MWKSVTLLSRAATFLALESGQAEVSKWHDQPDPQHQHHKSIRSSSASASLVYWHHDQHKDFGHRSNTTNMQHINEHSTLGQLLWVAWRLYSASTFGHICNPWWKEEEGSRWQKHFCFNAFLTISLSDCVCHWPSYLHILNGAPNSRTLLSIPNIVENMENIASGPNLPQKVAKCRLTAVEWDLTSRGTVAPMCSVW